MCSILQFCVILLYACFVCLLIKAFADVFLDGILGGEPFIYLIVGFKYVMKFLAT